MSGPSLSELPGILGQGLAGLRAVYRKTFLTRDNMSFKLFSQAHGILKMIMVT